VLSSTHCKGVAQVILQFAKKPVLIKLLFFPMMAISLFELHKIWRF